MWDSLKPLRDSLGLYIQNGLTSTVSLIKTKGKREGGIHLIMLRARLGCYMDLFPSHPIVKNIDLTIKKIFTKERLENTVSS